MSARRNSPSDRLRIRRFISSFICILGFSAFGGDEVRNIAVCGDIGIIEKAFGDL